MRRPLLPALRRCFSDKATAGKRSQLVRDFIDECLYDPERGYFTRNANIFTSGDPIAFHRLRDQGDYARLIHRLYREQTKVEGQFYQLWHTPSELFKPWYGNAVAQYIMDRFSETDERDLLIYEIGPGNGTLARNVLDCLKETAPGFYNRTQYHLVEISPMLAAQQQETLRDHTSRIQLHQQSFMDFNQGHQKPCFVLAMEVLDNLAHDKIKWDRQSGYLLECHVITDESASFFTPGGKFQEEFRPASDPLILELVQQIDAVHPERPYWKSLKWHPYDLVERLPLLGFINPWRHEFIPTGAYRLLKHLQAILPSHQLVISDFSRLPDTIPGWGAPVVQTRYQGDTVACSTYLVEPGLFDVFFPTDFELLSRLHQRISGGHTGQVLSHAKFCKKWADTKKTRTASGFNPMLEEFENVQMYLSVDK